ncbi:hypothetical protein SAMN04488146_104270 [Bacillus nitratireducens]|nr:hypothetical protein SAMN04488146_104270 [Bacillus nitratireducens]
MVKIGGGELLESYVKKDGQLKRYLKKGRSILEKENKKYMVLVKYYS